jgi:hypothetical protein
MYHPLVKFWEAMTHRNQTMQVNDALAPETETTLDISLSSSETQVDSSVIAYLLLNIAPSTRVCTPLQMVESWATSGSLISTLTTTKFVAFSALSLLSVKLTTMRIDSDRSADLISISSPFFSTLQES